MQLLLHENIICRSCSGWVLFLRCAGANALEHNAIKSNLMTGPCAQLRSPKMAVSQSMYAIAPLCIENLTLVMRAFYNSNCALRFLEKDEGVFCLQPYQSSSSAPKICKLWSPCIASHRHCAQSPHLTTIRKRHPQPTAVAQVGHTVKDQCTCPSWVESKVGSTTNLLRSRTSRLRSCAAIAFVSRVEQKRL